MQDYTFLRTLFKGISVNDPARWKRVQLWTTALTGIFLVGAQLARGFGYEFSKYLRKAYSKATFIADYDSYTRIVFVGYQCAYCIFM